MKCPVCKLEHEPAYAIETVCVTTLRDHLKAALELLAIREEQIGEFLSEVNKMPPSTQLSGNLAADQIKVWAEYNIKFDKGLGMEPGRYKIIVPDAAEREGPALTYPLTGTTYHDGDEVNIVAFQVNTPGVAEWGKLDNGNWIAVIWNSRLRVELVTVAPPPVDPPPPADAITLVSWTVTILHNGVEHTFHWDGAHISG